MANKKMIFPVLTKDEIMELRKNMSLDVAWDVIRVLRMKTEPSLIKAISLLTLAYINKENGYVGKENLHTLIKDAKINYSVALQLLSVLEELYDEVDTLAHRLSSEQILSVILSDSSWYVRNMGRRSARTSTPEAFSYLARALLKIEAGESVMDYCSGTGDFSLSTYLSTDADYICGVEISTEAVLISNIRMAFVGDLFQIEQGDSVTSKLRADKIFADPHFGMRGVADTTWLPKGASAAKCFGAIPRGKRMDWMFLLSALEKQKKNGRCVILSNDSMLFRGARGETEMRRYLVTSGLLEAVIALPEGILHDTNLQCDMLVFSQNNTKVKMIDARDCKVKEHNTSMMTSDNLAEVLKR